MILEVFKANNVIALGDIGGPGISCRWLHLPRIDDQIVVDEQSCAIINRNIEGIGPTREEYPARPAYRENFAREVSGGGRVGAGLSVTTLSALWRSNMRSFCVPCLGIFALTILLVSSRF